MTAGSAGVTGRAARCELRGRRPGDGAPRAPTRYATGIASTRVGPGEGFGRTKVHAKSRLKVQAKRSRAGYEMKDRERATDSFPMSRVLPERAALLEDGTAAADRSLEELTDLGQA